MPSPLPSKGMKLPVRVGLGTVVEVGETLGSGSSGAGEPKNCIATMIAPTMAIAPSTSHMLRLGRRGGSTSW